MKLRVERLEGSGKLMEDQSGAEKGFLYQQHEVNVGAMTCGITCGGRREAVEQEHGTTDNHLDCQNELSGQQYHISCGYFSCG